MEPAVEPEQAAAGLLTFFSIVGVLIQSYLDDPTDEYEEKVLELQEDRWRKVSTELADLFVQVEQDFSPTAVDEEDLTLSAKYSMFIKSQYNRGVLDDFEDELEDMDEPKQIFQNCREAYHTVFSIFMVAVVASVSPLVGSLIFEGALPLLITGIMLGVAGGAFLSGVWEGKKYQNHRRKLDEMWEDYYYH